MTAEPFDWKQTDLDRAKRLHPEVICELTSAHLRGVRIVTMNGILHAARAGLLDQNWRNTLRHPQRLAAVDQMYRDADELAMHELRELPQALWEPYATTDWRQALDAWHLASHEIIHARSVLMREIHTRERMAHLQALTAMRHSTQHLDQATIARVDERGLALDHEAFAGLAIEIRDRDFTGAWYRGGLVAGGEARDWVDWYQDRIGRWQDREAARKAQTQLRDPDYRAKLESLPPYWCGAQNQSY